MNGEERLYVHGAVAAFFSWTIFSDLRLCNERNALRQHFVIDFSFDSIQQVEIWKEREREVMMIS